MNDTAKPIAMETLDKLKKASWLLFWWFIASHSTWGSYVTQGPFASLEQCNALRRAVYEASPCWDDGRRTRGFSKDASS